MHASLSLLLLALAPAFVLSLNNGKSITPHMGWNTWNYHGCDINETVILDAARQLQASGLQQKGYKIVWIDDCWQADERDATTGEIPANPDKFPRGLKAVTDALHDMGFQAGIYSSAGTQTCGGKIGSLDHEDVDARSWAQAGFDALKYDNCHNLGRMGTPKLSYDRYFAMSDAVNKTGRPMIMSLCNWGEDAPWYFAPETWNSWRISGDIANTFSRQDDRCPCESMIDCRYAGFHCSVEKIINFAAPFGQKAKSGAWNDLDGLEVGNGGLSRDEEVTHFSMWAMVKSPLVMGNDMAKLSNQTLAILGNEAVLAVSQDEKYTPATRVWTRGAQQLWLAPLANASYAMALVNFDAAQTYHAPALSFRNDIFLDDVEDAAKQYDVYDLWSNVNFDDAAKSGAPAKLSGSPFTDTLPTFDVPPHGTRMFTFVPTNATTSPSMAMAARFQQTRSFRLGRQ